MKLVVFGLSVSSSWGNGHAVLWRALIRALARDGHLVVFFERDVPWYAQHRDQTEIEGGRLVLYDEWNAVRPLAERELADADAGMVTSYCPDGIVATELVLEAPGLHIFYDLDTPVTLDSLNRGEIDYQALIAGRPQATRSNPKGKFQLYRIGDAVASRNIHAAIYDALRLCKDF